jgi:hypothetical protein
MGNKCFGGGRIPENGKDVCKELSLEIYKPIGLLKEGWNESSGLPERDDWYRV